MLSCWGESTKLRASAVVMALLVGGCATTQQGTFVKAGGTQEEFKADYDYCMRTEYESTVVQSDEEWSAAMADLIMGASLLKACMQKFGYSYVVVNTADTRLGLGYTYGNGRITNLVDGGALHRAGFEVCDQIERVGDTAVLYDTDLISLQYSAEPIQFVVRRGDDRIERTVQPEMLDFSQAVYVLEEASVCSLPSDPVDESGAVVEAPLDLVAEE